MTDQNKCAPWNVKQIEQELRDSKAMCNSALERDVWVVYAAKDVKRIIGGRRCTPMECAILESLGIWVSNMSQPV